MKKTKLSILIKVALLGAISGILMTYIKFPLPFFPPFMEIDFGEIPAIIAGFGFGPIYGFLVVIIKIMIKLILNGTSTGFIGELSNLIVSSTLVVTSALIYKQKKTVGNAIFALTSGVILMSITATISNYYFIFPLYNLDIPEYAKVFNSINPLVKNTFTFLMIVIVPFNIIKGLLASIISILVFKPIRPYLKNS